MIAIKEMKMPNSCSECNLTTRKTWNYACSINLKDIDCTETKRSKDCPLVEVDTCEDAISRKSMLDYLKYLHGEMPEEEFVKALPSVIPNKDEWVPISERLPEIKQHVLLSCYGRVIYGRMISEDGNSGYPVFEICDSMGEKRPIVLETTAHNEFTTSRIIAWMPLPEPYREESEDA